MIREMSRRAMSTEQEGMACGPVSVYAADAEMTVKDSGHTVYLHLQYVEGNLFFEATTKSMYRLEKKISKRVDHEDFMELIDERDRLREETDISRALGITQDIRERYAEQYEQLVDMLQEVIDADEMDIDLREDEEEEEE